MRFASLALAAVLTFAPSFVPSRAQDEPRKEGGKGEPINKKFEDPNLDVDAFVKRFQSESREVYAKQKEILALCDLKPGMSVADIGAGTGLYAFPFAEAVGPKGTVYAVDISPAFLKHLENEAKKRGLADVVKPVKGGHETTNLPADSVDLVFICDAYHHFETPDPMLASIHRALRPGGRVVLLDFDKRPDASGFIKEHARAEKGVYFREFESAGFEQIPVENPPAMKENFVAMFRKK